MMKTFKRIGCAVVLLLAMALLTACSDGKTYYERAMENVPLPKGCSRWQYLPNDYDGDGEIEVFAFGGEEERDWKYLEVYYIDPQGNVKQVLSDSGLRGGPHGVKSDFSDCYLMVGKNKYAMFDVGSVYGSCGYTMVLGVYNKKPFVDYVDGTIDGVTSDGYVMVGGIEVEYVYAIRNGQFELVGEIYPEE